MSSSEDPLTVDEGAPTPDCVAAPADQPCLPGVLVHLGELPAHDPGGSLGQPALTVAIWAQMSEEKIQNRNVSYFHLKEVMEAGVC